MNNSIFLAAFSMSPWMIVSLVIIVILIVALVALSIYGKKLQTKQEQSQKELENAAQNASFLVIDKKRIKLSEAGLPSIILEQTPKYMRGRKVPIVKARVGAKIMPLMCDEKVFELIPVGKTVKARVSGIYIMSVSGLRGSLEKKEGKVKFSQRIKAKVDGMREKESAKIDKTTAKDSGKSKLGKKK